MGISRKRIGGQLIVGTLVFMFSLATYAMPFSSDIEIQGSITFDDENSTMFGTTQSGTLSSTLNGSSEISEIDGVTVSGDLSLTGALTNLNDGFGQTFIMSGDNNGDEGELYSDYEFDITNTSTTDTFQLLFEIRYENLVDADGVDSYADAKTTLDHGSDEIFFTDLTSDTFFGDKENGINLSSFGESLSHSGLQLIEFTIDPLETIIFDGVSELEGGVFDGVSSFMGSLSSFVSIVEVNNLTNPATSVPAPSALILLALGMLGMARVKKPTNEV